MTEATIREVLDEVLGEQSRQISKLTHDVGYLHAKVSRLAGMVKMVMLTVLSTNVMWVCWTVFHHLILE